MKPLTTVEINALAADIALNVKEKLDINWYDNSGISLSINWSADPELGAWASVAPTLENPVRHEITITYALVERLYHEAFDFAIFAVSPAGTKHPLGIHFISPGIGVEEAVGFMFESAILFLIFHELAHLNQGHGLIRAKYGQSGLNRLTISEFTKVKNDEAITGDLASIYHATELAADFEALDWMLSSLGAAFKGNELVDYAYLQCAIVSCIMLIFNGDRPAHLDNFPFKSHPYPWPRMEVWVQTYTERLVFSSQFFKIMLDKNSITKILMDASYLAILKWMTRLQLLEITQYEDFIRGALNHPNYNSYMREVVKLWDQEYKSARENRKYGLPFSVLYYSDEHRRMIGAAMNSESFSQHIEKSVANLENKRNNAFKSVSTK